MADSSVSPLVLVVEDDAETRRFYSSALAAHGFRIGEAHNGFQALEKAFADTPDLILTDISVPGLDGIELCRRLRADVRTAPVPVLAITGYAERHYPDRVMLAGANHVLLKPIDVDLLVREAQRLVRRPNS